MDERVDRVVSKFIHELTAHHPQVKVEVLGKQPCSTADTWVRIICPSLEEVADVMETEAHLTTGYYLDEGVYINCIADLPETAPLADEAAP